MSNESNSENKSVASGAEALKSVFDSLSDEQKEQAKACKTPEELAAFARKAGIELSDEALEAVAGGFVSIRIEKTVTFIDGLKCKEVDTVKYPCPKCGSWNVKNYDPGWFRQMRVACLQQNCRYRGIRGEKK